MSDEKRFAGDYEITHSIYIGDKELIMGENLKASDGNFYLVADCERNELFNRYDNCLVSNDFMEIAEIFSKRLSENIQQIKEEHNKITVPNEMLSWDKCIPMHECGDIADKVVVVDPAVLRSEHRNATKQIYIARSGNGVRADSLGSAVYCDNLYNGKHTRYERYDFIGVMKPEEYPDWVKEKLSELQQKQRAKKDKEVER